MSTQTQPLTPAQIDRQNVNRQNATHSTGPRTPEGKNRVRTNAVKHNLSGKELILEPSETEAYEELTRRLLASYKPVTDEETDILFAIRDSQWRLNSIPALHQNLLAVATQEHMEQYEEHAATPEQQRAMARVAGYRANMRLFEQFSRHEGRLQRSIAQMIRQLCNMMDERERHAQVEAKARAENQANQIAKMLPAKQSQPTLVSNICHVAKQSQPAAKTNQERIEAALYGKF